MSIAVEMEIEQPEGRASRITVPQYLAGVLVGSLLVIGMFVAMGASSSEMDVTTTTSLAVVDTTTELSTYKGPYNGQCTNTHVMNTNTHGVCQNTFTAQSSAAACQRCCDQNPRCKSFAWKNPRSGRNYRDCNLYSQVCTRFVTNREQGYTTYNKQRATRPPSNPCAKWKAEHAANAAIARALVAKVSFDPNQWTFRPRGKQTLQRVANILNRYEWMSINVQGHSSARGYHCRRLTRNRAQASMNFLKSKGVRNRMRTLTGACGEIMAITISNGGGQKAPPRGCRL